MKITHKLKQGIVVILLMVIAIAALTACTPTAATHTVMFDSMGGEDISKITVDHGAKITAPVAPTKDGFHFSGWYHEDRCVNPWYFDTDTVTEDITIYAKWTSDNIGTGEYLVTFNSQGGSTVKSITVQRGTKITAPTPPTKEGYAFKGWYNEQKCITAWNFDTDIVRRSIILYAKWTSGSVNPPATSFSVTFKSQGGSLVEKQTVKRGEKITQPTEPTKEGYSFSGWYREQTCVLVWNFDTDTVTENITLFAKWTPNVTKQGIVFVFENSTNSYYIDDYIGTDSHVAIPAECNGFPVTSIASRAFNRNSGLESITVADNSQIKSIGASAFYGCSGLKSVSFGKNSQIKSIGNSAFSGCGKLTNIIIPLGVTSIGQDAFHNCNNLTQISIPSSVKSIGFAAFQGCSSLTSVEIPQGVTDIDVSLFNGCSSLQSVKIPNTVKSIGSYAFYECSKLTDVSIPNGVTSIGNYAFSACSSIYNITLPASVGSIGDSAFKDCTNIISITIPNSVTSIGDNAFKGCAKLTIYCQCEEIDKPIGWAGNWNPDDRTIVWGHNISATQTQFVAGRRAPKAFNKSNSNII